MADQSWEMVAPRAGAHTMSAGGCMPRARHWGVPNRLSESTSPYLQQHADKSV
jgi:hypothetical protein